MEGMVLVYTPRTFDELEVLWTLVLEHRQATASDAGRGRPVT